MYHRPLWSSKHHNHHPCRNNLKSQWVSTGDPVGNRISISSAQTTLFPQSSFSERGTSSLGVCVDRGVSSVLLQDPISLILPQEVTDQDCAVPWTLKTCPTPCLADVSLLLTALPCWANAGVVGKAQSIKWPCQGLTKRELNRVGWREKSGKTWLETSVGKWTSGLEKDYIVPGKAPQVRPDLSHLKVLYQVVMTFNFLWNSWEFPKITHSWPNDKDYI